MSRRIKRMQARPISWNRPQFAGGGHYTILDAIRLRQQRSPLYIDCSERILLLDETRRFFELLHRVARQGSFDWSLLPREGIRGFCRGGQRDGFMVDPVTAINIHCYLFYNALHQVHEVAADLGFGGVSLNIVEATDNRPNSPLGLAIRRTLRMK